MEVCSWSFIVSAFSLLTTKTHLLHHCNHRKVIFRCVTVCDVRWNGKMKHYRWGWTTMLTFLLCLCGVIREKEHHCLLFKQSNLLMDTAWSSCPFPPPLWVTTGHLWCHLLLTSLINTWLTSEVQGWRNSWLMLNRGQQTSPTVTFSFSLCLPVLSRAWKPSWFTD